MVNHDDTTGTTNYDSTYDCHSSFVVIVVSSWLKSAFHYFRKHQ